MPHNERTRENITVQDKDISYGLFHRKTEIQGELFPDGGPMASDVRQGYTDLDCYLLAPLASIADKRPQNIKSCFTEYYDHNGRERNAPPDFKSAKNVKIRLFAFDKNMENKRKVIIQVDKTALRGKGVPWVRLLEKAILVYRAKGYDNNFGRSHINDKKIKSRWIDGTKGGEAPDIIAAITGKNVKTKNLVNSNDDKSLKKFPDQYSENAKKIYDKIKKHVSNQRVVTADAKYTSLFRIYRKGLFFCHEYSVLDAFEKNENGRIYKFIKVRNPYANRIREYNQDRKGKWHSKVRTPKEISEKGISDLELNNFLKNFENIHYT